MGIPIRPHEAWPLWESALRRTTWGSSRTVPSGASMATLSGEEHVQFLAKRGNGGMCALQSKSPSWVLNSNNPLVLFRWKPPIPELVEGKIYRFVFTHKTMGFLISCSILSILGSQPPCWDRTPQKGESERSQDLPEAKSEAAPVSLCDEVQVFCLPHKFHACRYTSTLQQITN